MAAGRVTVIVGGASGIGWATAQAMAAGGGLVVIGDVAEERAAARAEELVARHGGRHRGVHVDVADEPTVEALFDGVLEQEGGFHGAVSCAGVSTLARVVDHDASEWRRVVDVCLTGSFLVLKHAGRRVADGGSLVSLSSLNARQPGVGMAAYCASKAGLVALTEVAALELGARKVRVNAVAPGLVLTPLTAGVKDIPGVLDDYVENTALGRSGEPEEIAAAIAFLLSDSAAWITGETLDINGGAHLKRYPDLVGHVEEAFA